MKRILIGSAAVLACVILCVCIFVGGRSDAISCDGGISLNVVEGGELFDLTYWGFDRSRCSLISISSKTDRYYTYGGFLWEDGYAANDDFPAGPTNGYVEIKTNGRWEKACDIKRGFTTGFEQSDEWLVSPDSDKGKLIPICLYSWTGKIRVTLFFRECVPVGTFGDKGLKCTSVGELIPVTFEISVPERTGKAADIVELNAEAAWLRTNGAETENLRLIVEDSDNTVSEDPLVCYDSTDGIWFLSNADLPDKRTKIQILYDSGEQHDLTLTLRLPRR